MTRWITPLAAIVAFGLAIFAQAPVGASLPVVHGSTHDFDFEFGAWDATLRIRKPFSTQNAWTEYRGVSTVTPIWGGLANYGILDVRHGAGRVRGLTLRLFQPAAKQWYIRFSNSATGKLGTPAVGGFQNGEGFFYDTESFKGRSVNVRFIFSQITPRSFHFAQSYSDDGGATWVVNWDSTFTRRG